MIENTEANGYFVNNNMINTTIVAPRFQDQNQN